jgi:kynurenine formamidase
MKIYDLSVPIESSPGQPQKVEIIYQDHAQGVKGMQSSFGCEKTDLPAGLGWAGETVTLHTHAGTHVDAPWHYTPVSQGKKARTIDRMPIEWFYGDGVVLDMRHKPNGSGITVNDLKIALIKIDYNLKKGDIVFIQTGADKYWGKEEYYNAGCGMTRESTLWLINQGIKVMGIDAWGFDRPFWAIKEDFQKFGDKNIIWAAHYVGIEKEYCQIEKLANLDKLPRPFGFKVACFPVKISKASAGWVRVAAIFDK